jgi:syntaxin 16
MREKSNSIYEDEPFSEPQWLSLSENIKYETEKLSEKIERLHEDQESYTRSKTSALFEEDENSPQLLEQEIESKSQEITLMFNRLHSMIMDLKSMTAGRHRNNKLLKNILQRHFRAVSSLSETFRSYQREHLSCLNEKEKYMEQFVINFDDVDFMDHSHQQIRFPENDRLAHSDSSIGFENRNYQTQDQLQIDDLDNDLIRERDAEMTEVMKSLVELNQIFQEMSAMVVHQGTLMDRIDYNMESVQMRVNEGAIQLAQAERSAARTRKLKCFFILCGSVFLALLIMILQS